MQKCVINLKPILWVVSLLLSFTLFSLPAFSVPLSGLATAQAASEKPEETPTVSKTTTSLIATLSDEQVRKLLIEELQRNNASSLSNSVLSHEVPGPGAFFGGLLQSLTQKSDSSEKEVRQLLTSIPDVFPDLKRVFLSL